MDDQSLLSTGALHKEIGGGTPAAMINKEEENVSEVEIQERNRLVSRRGTQLSTRSTRPVRKIGYAEQHHAKKLNEKCKINRSKVVEEAQNYRSVEYGNIKMTNLPKYDDITTYGNPKDFPHEKQLELWTAEIDRLATSVDIEGKSQSLFDSERKLNSLSKDTRHQLHKVADQIYCNLAILYHDNINLDPSLAKSPEPSTTRFAVLSKDILEGRLNQYLHRSPDDSMTPRPPEVLEEHNEEIYYLMVDHITALLAVVLCRSVFSEMWQNNVIAILAKYSTKLKIVLKDPMNFAAASLENAEAMQESALQNSYFDWLDSGYLSLLEKKEKGWNPSALYHFHERASRDTIHYLIIHILSVAFRPHRPFRNTEQRKELCSKVYRNGKDSFHTIIANDADGGFAVTSEVQQLRVYRTALDVLLRRCKLIDDKQQLVPLPAPGESSEYLRIDWKWWLDGQHTETTGRPGELDHSPKNDLEVTNMDSAVSILTSFALCDPHATIEIKALIDMRKRVYSMFHDHHVFEYYDENFTSEISLSISTEPAVASLPVSKIGAIPLSSPRNIHTLKESIHLRDRVLPGASLLNPPEGYEKYAKKFDRQLSHTWDWQIDENSIVVRCRWFAWPILGLAALFAIGGAVIPFTGRVRLPGVDPSNLSTYIWLAVAFVLLIIQSMYVPHWTWHDFLRARVRCHSLSELANVTNCDPQIIIHRLLIDERQNILNTRGPYNSMFTRKDNGGFAIDVPTLTSTLYASGFVLFVCLNTTGQRLICQDARPGGSLVHLTHMDNADELGCQLSDESTAVAHEHGSTPLRFVLEERGRYYVRGLYLQEREFA